MTPMVPLPRDHTSHLRVGVVLYPGAALRDCQAPLQYLGALRNVCYSSVEVVTIAPQFGSINASPIHDLTIGYLLPPPSCWQTMRTAKERIDVVLVPGGPLESIITVVHDTDYIDFIGDMVEHAQLVLRVGVGAYIVASTGCLDHRRATSDHGMLDVMTSTFNAVQWQRHELWVGDGKFWSSSDASAGMAMSRSCVGEFFGQEAADLVGTYLESQPNGNMKDEAIMASPPNNSTCAHRSNSPKIQPQGQAPTFPSPTSPEVPVAIAERSDIKSKQQCAISSKYGQLCVWTLLIIAPMIQDIYGNLMTLSDFFQVSTYFIGIQLGTDFYYNVSDLHVSRGFISWGKTQEQLYVCALLRECDRPLLEWYVHDCDITSCSLVAGCFPTGETDPSPVSGKQYTMLGDSVLVVRGNNSYEVAGRARRQASGLSYSRTSVGYLYHDNFHSLPLLGNFRATIILVDYPVHPAGDAKHGLFAQVHTAYIGPHATIIWTIAVVTTCTAVVWQAVLIGQNVRDRYRQPSLCIVEGRLAQTRNSITFVIIELGVGLGAMVNIFFPSNAMAFNSTLTPFEKYQLLSSMIKVLKLVVMPLTYICLHLEVRFPIVLMYRRVLSITPVVALGLILSIPSVRMSYNLPDVVECSALFPQLCTSGIQRVSKDWVPNSLALSPKISLAALLCPLLAIPLAAINHWFNLHEQIAHPSSAIRLLAATKEGRMVLNEFKLPLCEIPRNKPLRELLSLGPNALALLDRSLTGVKVKFKNNEVYVDEQGEQCTMERLLRCG